MVRHSSLQSVSTQSTLRGAKHFKQRPNYNLSLIVIQGSGSGREMKTY